MSMLKRIFFFGLVNIAMMVMINIVMRALGIEPYLHANGLNYTSLAIMCGLWGMMGSFISLAMSKWMAKSAMGVQIVEANGQFSDLVNTVHRLAKAANLPKMPEVGVYQSAEVNAFATGPSKSNSLVAVSTGLLQNMNRDEVEGVLAHEIAHIANGDMVTMALVQGVVNSFVLFFAKIAAFALDNFVRDENGRGGLGLLGRIAVEIVLQIVFGILGSIVVAWFSRMREYRADAGGAKLAGKSSMVNALKRLQSQFEAGGHFDRQEDQIAAFKISSKPSGLKALFSTHPPLGDRIARLERYDF